MSCWGLVLVGLGFLGSWVDLGISLGCNWGCSVFSGLFLGGCDSQVDEWCVNGHFFCCSSADSVDLFVNIGHNCCRGPSANLRASCSIYSLIEERHCSSFA